ncbi:MAG: FecR domain-containing protein [Planctomycetota bacterium]
MTQLPHPTDGDLLARALDGELSDAEASALADRLQTEPTLAQEYLRLAQDEALLQEAFAGGELVAAESPSPNAMQYDGLADASADESRAEPQAGTRRPTPRAPRRRSAGHRSRRLRSRRSPLVRIGLSLSALVSLAAVAVWAVLYVRQSGTATTDPALVGQVVALVGSGRIVHPGAGATALPAQVGSLLMPGDVVNLDAGSQLDFEYPDGTHATLGAGSALTLGAEHDGKRLDLSTGEIEIEAAHQPAGRPMGVDTTQAEARVVGTHFRVRVEADRTRLEVDRGCVHFTRLSDRAAVDVTAGTFAEAGTGIQLAVQPLTPPAPPPSPALAWLEKTGQVTINFGPDGITLPAGAFNDAGDPFDATRGYGWDGPKQGAAFAGGDWTDDQGHPHQATAGRNAGRRDLNADPLRDSAIAAGWNHHAETWHMALPDGQYTVRVCVGDALSAQGPQRVQVEGITVVDGAMTDSGKFLESPAQAVQVQQGTLTVAVGGGTDGRVSQDGSSDTTICFLTIEKAR